MKTFELTGDSEELILEKFKDGSVELSIEYETPDWGSSDVQLLLQHHLLSQKNKSLL